MSRTRRFATALGSGYLALAANVIYTAFSIPLALHYLSREEFGLWAVILQITGYLTLLDFGVGQSVARILVDYKDEPNAGEYGATLKTASVVFVLQAIGILVLGGGCSPFFGALLQVPSQLRSDFNLLMVLQCTILAANCALTPLWIPLWSHQRSDVVNLASVAIFIANGIVLWIGFAMGLKYFSLVFANFAGISVYLGVTASATIKLGFLPKPGCWGKVGGEKFREIFGFSRDLFILQVATQFISASQIVLVSRLLGLESAGVWSICTKTFTLAQQIVSKIYEFSAPGFSEMFVRGELPRFRERLATVISISAVAAGFFAVLGAFGNRTLVSFWTAGKATWDQSSDILAAAYLVVVCVTRCYTGVTGIVKRVGNYKYFSLLEGVIVVLGSVFLARRLGFSGLFLAAIVANLICSASYGTSLVTRIFNSNWKTVVVHWLWRALLFILMFSCFAGVSFWIGGNFHGFLPFMVTAFFAAVIGSALASFVGIKSETRREVLSLIAQLTHGRRSYPDASP